MKVRARKVPPKPNLTSVLDAVFIFIFFLLMSAQFLKIHTFDSNAPAISLVKEESKELPLNLTLEVNDRAILVKTGLDGDLKKTIPKVGKAYDLPQLRAYIIELKKLNIHESSVSLRPEENVAYDDLVKIIDSVRALNEKEGMIQGKGKKGEVLTTKQLFDQVIFESVI